MTTAKFRLGRVVATPGALAALTAAGQTPWEFFTRYRVGDWGELDDDDRHENIRSLKDGCRHKQRDVGIEFSVE